MGALLRGVKREQVKRGQILCAPGSMKSVNKFKAQVYVSISEAIRSRMFIILLRF
jgi:translation elongation factor EF-Tu-like GTPase